MKSRNARLVLESYRLDAKGRMLVRSRSVGEQIGQGPVRVIITVW